MNIKYFWYLLQSIQRSWQVQKTTYTDRQIDRQGRHYLPKRLLWLKVWTPMQSKTWVEGSDWITYDSISVLFQSINWVMNEWALRGSRKEGKDLEEVGCRVCLWKACLILGLSLSDFLLSIMRSVALSRYALFTTTIHPHRAQGKALKLPSTQISETMNQNGPFFSCTIYNR